MNTGAVTVSLLLALRRLAACLKASSRAYVDPTDLLKIISELNTNLNKAVPCIGIQQVFFLLKRLMEAQNVFIFLAVTLKIVFLLFEYWVMLLGDS